MTKAYSKSLGFTIVELLVVIVVIGVLAAITIVSYTGISQKATAASLQSDLNGASNKLKMYQVEYSGYPTGIAFANNQYCPNPDLSGGKYCFKASPGNSFTSIPYSNPTPQSFILTAVNGSNTYHITENSASIAGAYASPNWLTIGTQTWAKANLNIGTMVTGVTTQTNNSILEKYCYGNLESNCTTYGGLYQWDEAMQYVTTAGAQGVCPAGSHIPSDGEWSSLSSYLGGESVAGTALIPGGSAGFSDSLTGFRRTGGTFNWRDSVGTFWSSTQSSQDAWFRYMVLNEARLYRYTFDGLYGIGTKTDGLSVRCLKD